MWEKLYYHTIPYHAYWFNYTDNLLDCSWLSSQAQKSCLTQLNSFICIHISNRTFETSQDKKGLSYKNIKKTYYLNIFSTQRGRKTVQVGKRDEHFTGHKTEQHNSLQISGSITNLNLRQYRTDLLILTCNQISISAHITIVRLRRLPGTSSLQKACSQRNVIWSLKLITQVGKLRADVTVHAATQCNLEETHSHSSRRRGARGWIKYWALISNGQVVKV